MVVALIAVGGLGAAALHPVGGALAHRTGRDRARLAVSLFSAGGQLGAAVGALVAVAVLATFGLGGTPWLMAPGVALAAVLLVALPRDPPRRPCRHVPRRCPRSGGPPPDPWCSTRARARAGTRSPSPRPASASSEPTMPPPPGRGPARDRLGSMASLCGGRPRSPPLPGGDLRRGGLSRLLPGLPRRGRRSGGARGVPTGAETLRAAHHLDAACRRSTRRDAPARGAHPFPAARSCA